jgi:surface antigen
MIKTSIKISVMILAMIFLLGLPNWRSSAELGAHRLSAAKQTVETGAIRRQPPSSVADHQPQEDVIAAAFGTNLGDFNGVTVFSNGSPSFNSGQNNYINGTYIGLKWQCVEYVRRYYFTQFAINLAARYLGNANTWYDNAGTMGLQRFPNGSNTAPQVGDVLTSNGGFAGHIAIVRSVSGNQVCTAQQNFSEDATDVNRCLSLTNTGGNFTVGAFGSGYPVQGWLRRQGTTPPPCANGSSVAFRPNGGPPTHPNGSFIRDPNNPTVYLLQNGQKRPITSPDVLFNLYDNGEFDFSDVIAVASDELAQYPTGAIINGPLPSNGRGQPDGRLIRQVGGAEVSIVTNIGMRRPFASGQTFTDLGYSFCKVTEVSDYNSYPTGPIVDPVVRSLTVNAANANGSVGIAVTPLDNNGFGDGGTAFTRTYSINASVFLTATPTVGNATFQKWQRDGVDLTTNLSATVVMNANHTMTAVYAASNVNVTVLANPANG